MKDRVGEVWEVKWYNESDTFIVLGRAFHQGEHCYTLLNLELGAKDYVRTSALDEPSPENSKVSWERIA